MNTRSQIARVVGMVLVPLQLILIVYLVITISKSPLPERGQKKSSLTGLPIWSNTPCPKSNSVDEKTLPDYIEFGATIITGVASLICICKGLMTYLSQKDTLISRVVTKLEHLLSCCISRPQTRRLPLPDEGDGNGTPSTKFGTIFLFDTIITAYVTVTFIALVVGLIVSIGKLWSIVGIFHNVLEVFIVAALCYRKTIKYVAYTCIFISVYSVVVTGIIGRLHWYWDATFFKFQGLILDFILPVLFFVMPRKDPNGETQPLNNKKIPLPHVSYLVFASFVHLVGNLSDVAGGDSASASVIFNLSYFVAFPIFAIYAFDKSDGETQSEDDFLSTDITVSDFILLLLWGTTASTISVLFGLINIRCPT